MRRQSSASSKGSAHEGQRSDRALERVSEVALFIAQDSKQAATRWVERLFEEVERLAGFPELGKPGRDIAAPGVRELVVGDFRVFYEVHENIEILTVRRSRELIDESELVGD